MAVAAKVRPADLAGKLCSVEPLEHRQLLSAAYGGGWVFPRAHAPGPVARSAAVTVERVHANSNAAAPRQATGRGEDGWDARPGEWSGVDPAPRAAPDRVRQGWASAGDGDSDDAPAWRFGRAPAPGSGAGSDVRPATRSAGGDGEAAAAAAAGTVVKHTVEVVGEELVVRAGQGLQRLFVPLAVMDRAEVVTQSAAVAANRTTGNGAGPAATRAPQWRSQEPEGPQDDDSDEPDEMGSAAGVVSAQYVSRNLAGGGDISPHLARATDGVAPPQVATGAQAVVQGVMATSTAAVARATGDLLAGGRAAQAAVAGAVEGVAGAGAVARAAVLGSAQGFFRVAMAAVSERANPSQYVRAEAPLTAAQVATQRVAAVTSKAAQVAAAAEQVLPAAVEAAVGQLVPAQFIHIPRVDALASFNDAMLAFIDDSAMTPPPVNHSRTRAWVVTVVVIAADVALLVHWYRGASERQQAKVRPKLGHQATA
jgi:hypothetical protein